MTKCSSCCKILTYDANSIEKSSQQDTRTQSFRVSTLPTAQKLSVALSWQWLGWPGQSDGEGPTRSKAADAITMQTPKSTIVTFEIILINQRFLKSILTSGRFDVDYCRVSITGTTRNIKVMKSLNFFPISLNYFGTPVKQ